VVQGRLGQQQEQHEQGWKRLGLKLIDHFSFQLIALQEWSLWVWDCHFSFLRFPFVWLHGALHVCFGGTSFISSSLAI
jgi:hypothetical protein